MSDIQTVFYIYFFSLALLAVWFFRKGYNNLAKREPILQRIKHRNMLVKKQLKDGDLESKLKNAGYPLRLNAWRFQSIRYVGCASWFVYLISNLDLSLIGPLDVIKVSMPLLMLYLTHPNRLITKYWLALSKEQYDHQKNQELFMLYSMISDEIKDSNRSIPNISGLLRKLRHYTPRIQYAINKGLRYTNQGIQVAMNKIAEEIGTSEAKHICKIIADLEVVNHHNLLDIISSREKEYIASLRASRKKRRMRFANFVSAMVFLPLFVYMMDILYVILQMLKYMTSNISNV